MSFPAVAARTYERLKNYGEVKKLSKNLSKKLLRIKNPIKRARYIHHKVDESIEELFKDEIVKKHTQCKKGCSACCHTQVSISEDEAILLTDLVVNGAEIDWVNFYRQAQAKNDDVSFFAIPYDQRACIFLGDQNECTIYDDRPSVCRTNHSVSDPALCDTKDGVLRPIRLLTTVMGDLLIYFHFKFCRVNGAMANMIYQQISAEKKLPIRRPPEL